MKISSLLGLIGYLLIVGGLILALVVWLKSIKRPDSKADPTYQEQDAALSQEIAKRRGINKAAQLGQIIFSAAMIIGMIAFLAASNYVLPVVLSIIWGVGCALFSGARQDVKGFAAENIVRKALEEVFEIAEYDPFGHIPQQRVSSADFGFKEHDEVAGNDYVRGAYKGLPIEMCDIQLVKVTEYQDDTGIDVTTELFQIASEDMLCEIPEGHDGVFYFYGVVQTRRLLCDGSAGSHGIAGL